MVKVKLILNKNIKIILNQLYSLIYAINCKLHIIWAKSIIPKFCPSFNIEEQNKNIMMRLIYIDDYFPNNLLYSKAIPGLIFEIIYDINHFDITIINCKYINYNPITKLILEDTRNKEKYFYDKTS